MDTAYIFPWILLQQALLSSECTRMRVRFNVEVYFIRLQPDILSVGMIQAWGEFKENFKIWYISNTILYMYMHHSWPSYLHTVSWSQSSFCLELEERWLAPPQYHRSSYPTSLWHSHHLVHIILCSMYMYMYPFKFKCPYMNWPLILINKDYT